ncbi:MAG TPA: guanylate kinase [Planctomycetota bacterium]|nr:guanylate kinase [Planctomycetota bacterium]
MTDRTQRRGAIVVISGPSGAGKTTLVKRILGDDPELVWSVSATTRAPREDELDGRDYHFLSREAFEHIIASDDLAEWAESFDNLYGTPAGPLREGLEAGRVLILDIDVQGARQIRRKFPDAVLVFVRPPNTDALVERLRRRRSETPDQFQTRLERARSELDCADEYDHVIVNDDLEKAVRTLGGLVQEIKERRGGEGG